MLKKTLSHPLVWIFVLALFLRFWHLTSLPSGLHVDEVKVGWNAYSLFLTGRDDWWHAFPLHYDTFGDQRPTGLFYASVPALAAFGLNEFAVRFTPAVFGSLAVLAVFFLARQITRNNSVASLSALMLAVSPWHITLSRATSEGIVATTLILLAMVFQIRAFSRKSFSPAIISLLFYLSSYFFYHTSRLLIPLFIFTIIVYYRKIRFTSLLLLGCTSLLTLILAFSPAARGRLSQVSIFSDQSIKIELDRLPFEEGNNHIFLARALHNKIVLYASRFFNEYSQYLSGKFFLSSQEAKPSRYQTATKGLLLYSEFVLLAIGLVSIAQKKFPSLPFLMLLLSPLPAALTTEDAPNLHRSLVMSPFISIIAGFGLLHLLRTRRQLFSIAILVLAIELFHYSHLYIVHNPVRDALTLPRNVGAKELIAAVMKLSPAYTNIYLTNRPDHLYPWFAFLTHQDPRQFNPLLSSGKSQDWNYNHVIFSQFRCPSSLVQDQNMQHTLAVDAEGCPTPTRLVNVENITRISGGTTYSLWSSKD